jgi:HK97 gp10 family phage protein
VATVKVEGFKELEKALAELPKATAKNVAKRTLMEAAEPVDEAATANAPFMRGKLERSVVTGTKLTRRQKGRSASWTGSGFRSESKNYVEVHIGTKLSRGMFTEFGTFKDRAQGWFTKAWHSTQMKALDIIKERLGEQISKAATRLAKKRAKQ